MSDVLPGRSRCVVIGGGVGGASVAYHLARGGETEVLLLEQHALTDGTTWHSAGFVGQLRSTISQTRMIMYSSGLYAELEELTGLDPGWNGVGGLRLATTPERVQELRRHESAAATYGLELDLLGPTEAGERAPLIVVNDVLAAAWLPGDGWLDPARLAAALAAGARAHGATLAEHTRVTGLDVRDGRVRAVETDAGRVECEVVVVAAGCASREVAALAGAVVPVVPMRHQYVVTEPLAPAVPPETTTVRDPDHIVYLRAEEGALLVGGYARDPVSWDTSAPLAEPRTLFDADPERFGESWAAAVRRVPALREASVARTVNGPEAFTPDGEFLLGETVETDGLWVAAGFCVHGLAGAGGVGKVMAEWITDGQPEWDVASMDIRRFGRPDASRAHARVRALEAYGRYYDVILPGEERRAGRPLRLSPTYPRLAELGAAWGEKAGWERANWFAPNAEAGDESLRPRGWAGVHWSPAIGAECHATAERAGLFDQSSFSKLEVRGTGALAALQRLCANDLDTPPGRATYTQLLNPRGGIEADLTVTRVEDDVFRLVTGTAFGVRDLAWIRRHLRRDGSVIARDVTSAEACLCLWGPLAREILQPLTGEDLSHTAFPFLRARTLSLGPVPVLAQRITFVGELGWELYCPVEYGLALWDLLWEVGRPHGMLAAGYRAIDSMRLEKGYRVWGADITPETTPHEAGLSFAVRDGGGFIGAEALAAAGAPDRRLRCLVLDDPRTVCLGTEPVWVDGRPAGRVTSGGYGNRVGASIAYALLPAAIAPGDRVQVGVFGEWLGAVVVEEPLYDPEMERVRAAGSPPASPAAS